MRKLALGWLRSTLLAVCFGGLATVAGAQAPTPAPAAKPAASTPAATGKPVSAPMAAAAKPAASAVASANPAAPTPLPTGLVKMPDGRVLAPDIARIVARGELVVAMLGVDTPPFFYEKNGELVGLEVDLAKAMAKELGVNVRFNRNAKSFNGVVDVIARGEADVAISKLSRTLARTQVISFTDPYLTLNHALILNRVAFAQFARERPLPDVIRRFTGTIGVINRSSFQDYAGRYFPKAVIKTYPGWPDVLKALEKGEVMAAYRDEFEVKRILKSDSTLSLTLRTVTLKDLQDTLGIAVSINDRTLLAFANEFLAQRGDKLNITKVLGALEN